MCEFSVKGLQEMINARNDMMSTSQIVPISFDLGTASDDRVIISPEKDKKSISIDQIHILTKRLSAGPLKEQLLIAIITPADALTLPAQQALLKVLEEPPRRTHIILATNYPQMLLPTILSRCLSTQVSSTKYQVSTKIELPVIKSYSDAIRIAEKTGTSKEDAIRTCAEMLFFYRRKGDLQKQKKLLEAIQLLSKNCNVKLVLEHVFFTFVA